MNNPLLNELRSENPLWMHPERAAQLKIANGDKVEVSNGGVSMRTVVQVTPMIHPDAVFLLHGFGRSVPRQKRASGKGIADQRLQVGILNVFDPAGGCSAMTEAVVRVRPAGIAGSSTPDFQPSQEAGDEQIHPAAQSRGVHRMPGVPSSLQDQ